MSEPDEQITLKELAEYPELYLKRMSSDYMMEYNNPYFIDIEANQDTAEFDIDASANIDKRAEREKRIEKITGNHFENKLTDDLSNILYQRRNELARSGRAAAVNGMGGGDGSNKRGLNAYFGNGNSNGNSFLYYNTSMKQAASGGRGVEDAHNSSPSGSVYNSDEEDEHDYDSGRVDGRVDGRGDDGNGNWRESRRSNAMEVGSQFSIDNDYCGSFKKLTIEDIEKSLEKYYDYETKYSNELDILITYLKGQKNLYIQCKNYHQKLLNILIVPSLFFTTAMTVFSPFIYNLYWGGLLLSGVNVIITFSISLSNYLKLESTVHMFLNLANQYEKLQTSLELTNNMQYFTRKRLVGIGNGSGSGSSRNGGANGGTVAMVSGGAGGGAGGGTVGGVDGTEEDDKMLEKIRAVEKKLNEITEANYLLIPIYVRNLFPVICNINIFSFIKKIEMYRTNLIVKMKDTRNEMRWIVHKWKLRGKDIFTNYPNEPMDFTTDKTQMTKLMEKKEKLKDELINYKNAYGYIDEIFVYEIKNAENYNALIQIIKFLLCIPAKKLEFKYSNPFIDEYVKFVFK